MSWRGGGARATISTFFLGTFAGYLLSVTRFGKDIEFPSSDGNEKKHIPDSSKKIAGKGDNNAKLPGKEHKATEKFIATISKEGAVSNTANDDSKPIKIVVQRCRYASLLINPGGENAEKDPPVTATFGKYLNTEQNKFSDDGSSSRSSVGGIIVYLSFAKSAQASMIYNAAKTLLNLPILTKGQWGDGNKTLSVLQIAADLYRERKKKSTSDEQEKKDEIGSDVKSIGSDGEISNHGGVAMMIIPQANLVSKVKNMGKSVQYHDQIKKQRGSELFEEFVKTVKLIALEHQITTEGCSIQGAHISSKKSPGYQTPNASAPPEEIFRDEALYSSWDDCGFPLTDIEGNPIKKSAMKKLRKRFEAQKKRYTKYLDSGAGTSSATNVEKKEEKLVQEVDEKFIKIVAGTFGNRQGLDFSSDMGPFCHVLHLG
mmetsp:Transcript_29976/g.44428  ORF Transcript_29976/g.44428 Transcript_29976/m.44428 type:complete len:429 (+) Transcript_29976:3-1289(+)